MGIPSGPPDEIKLFFSNTLYIPRATAPPVRAIKKTAAILFIALLLF
jgi:hypothetical protein